MNRMGIAIGMGCVMAASAAHADVLADWTFEVSGPIFAALNNTPVSGSYAAEGGLFAATSFARGVHASANTDYSSPAGNGSAESFSSNEWTIGDYYEFETSTLGFRNITIEWNQVRSGTGPGIFDLEYSVDGMNFITLLDDYTVLENSAANGGFWNSTTFIPNYVLGPVAGPAVLDDQATIWFRLTNQVTPGSTGGTNRVDNVVINGTLIPTPGTLGLLAFGAIVALRRRR